LSLGKSEFIRVASLGSKGRATLKARLATLAVAVLAVLGAATLPVRSAEPPLLGLWQKVGDNGRPIIWILFVERNGSYEGAMVKLFPRPQDPINPTCAKCDDDRKDAPLLGLSFIRDMKLSGSEYVDGNILDARDGKVYRAMMTVSPDGQTLTVRGYVGIPLFGMNEVWYRLPDSAVEMLDPAIIAKFRADLPASNSTASAIRPKTNLKANPRTIPKPRTLAPQR
jgi:hypothetical protein